MTSSGSGEVGPSCRDRGRAGGGIRGADAGARKARVGEDGKGFFPWGARRDVTAPRRRPRTTTYAASGVGLAGRDRALRQLLNAARYRPPASHGVPLAAPGHFAGFVRLGRETIALTTDTVGTKVLLAEALGRWEEVGEDAVAINVNDLAAVGARPTAVVDTILCGVPRVPVFRALGRGLRRGLEAARCALVGGETALVGEMVRGLDLGATAVGFYPGRRRPILGHRVRPGDALVGLAASGLHANGFTLVRRLLDEASVRLDRPRPGGRVPVGRELLTATRTYSSLVDAVADDPSVVGLAHLSGGGVRNLSRLRTRVRFVLDRWPAPGALYPWLQTLGGLADREMFQTFNMGVGFVLVVRTHGVARVLRRLGGAGGSEAGVIGHVASGEGVELPHLGLRYRGYR